MARVNIYLPDELADRARSEWLNVSALAQAALHGALAREDTNRWLDRVGRHSRVEITHKDILRALDEAREDLGAER